jgi:transposase
MFKIRVLVKTLLCLDCAAKHGKPDATFERGPDASVYAPRSLFCPRCGGQNTLPEVDVQVTDMTRQPPRPHP